MGLAKILSVFQTKYKAMEVNSLIKGSKPVVRHGFYDDELSLVEKFCSQNNLKLIKSEFKILMLDKDKNFSNKGIRISKDDPKKGMFFVYISKDELLAYKAAYYEITNDNYNLGLILGYPRCCCEFFNEQYPTRSKLDNDYAFLVLENSKGSKFPFQNNIFQRHNDVCLLSHFPCNLNCTSSIKIGAKNLNNLRICSTEVADEFEKKLKKNANSKLIFI